MSNSNAMHSRTNPKLLGFALILAAILAFPACWVTSINPLYEEWSVDQPQEDPDLVFDQGLIGSWSRAEDKCVTLLAIEAKDQVYGLQGTDQGEGCAEADKPTHTQARLVKLDNHYFFDISAINDDVCDMCRPVHNIFLVKWDKTTLSLTPIDSDWLKKSIAAKTLNIATLSGDTDTITASSRDLKAFCRKFAYDARVFGPEMAETFIRTH